MPGRTSFGQLDLYPITERERFGTLDLDHEPGSESFGKRRSLGEHIEASFPKLAQQDLCTIGTLVP